MAEYESEQQKLNARARAIGHRIENLKTVGEYKLHKTGTDAFYLVLSRNELYSLISNLEVQHGAG